MQIHESDCLQERGGWLCLVMIILVTERVTAVEPTLRMLITMLMMWSPTAWRCRYYTKSDDNMKNDVSHFTNLGQASRPSPVPDRTQHGRHDRPQSRPQAPGLLHRDDSQRSPHCPWAAGEPRQTRARIPSNLLLGWSYRLQIHSIPDICLQGSAAASQLGHSSRAHWPAKHEHHNQVLIYIACVLIRWRWH